MNIYYQEPILVGSPDGCPPEIHLLNIFYNPCQLTGNQNSAIILAKRLVSLSGLMLNSLFAY